MVILYRHLTIDLNVEMENLLVSIAQAGASVVVGISIFKESSVGDLFDLLIRLASSS